MTTRPIVDEIYWTQGGHSVRIEVNERKYSSTVSNPWEILATNEFYAWRVMNPDPDFKTNKSNDIEVLIPLIKRYITEEIDDRLKEGAQTWLNRLVGIQQNFCDGTNHISFRVIY